MCPLLIKEMLLYCMFYSKRLPVGFSSFQDVFSGLKLLSEGLYTLGDTFSHRPYFIHSVRRVLRFQLVSILLPLLFQSFDLINLV